MPKYLDFGPLLILFVCFSQVSLNFQNIKLIDYTFYFMDYTVSNKTIDFKLCKLNCVFYSNSFK